MTRRQYRISTLGMCVSAALVAAVAGSASGAVGARPDVTARVSVGTRGAQATGESTDAAISAHGRFVAFQSAAPNLVSADTNQVQDIFVRDRVRGVTRRLPLGRQRPQPNGDSFTPDISGNGRFVVFTSSASNLVRHDSNDTLDVFVVDRWKRTVERVSVGSHGRQTDAASFEPAISATGRWVVFSSPATNLVPGDTNLTTDVFVHDRWAHTTTRVSVGTGSTQAEGYSRYGGVSADGRYVSFSSDAGDLVADDTNGLDDVFLRDLRTGLTRKVSTAVGGSDADGASVLPVISDNGRVVAFESTAANLVAGDTNRTYDVFAWDRRTRLTTRASVADDGSESRSGAFVPAVSGDGRRVTFESADAGLVVGDTNRVDDVFVRDLDARATSRVSVDSLGVQGDKVSTWSDISSDGRHICFVSFATTLVPLDTNGVYDIFVRDLSG